MEHTHKSNLERMIRLADEFFQAKSDPYQLSVDEKVIEQLYNLHPNTVAEEKDVNGPIAWTIVIPTTNEIMKRSLSAEINEQEILSLTKPQAQYDAIYLCSALVLPEYRRKGIAKRMLIDSIQAICSDHPIRTLFYWSFSTEGERLAKAVARELALPLLKRD